MDVNEILAEWLPQITAAWLLLIGFTVHSPYLDSLAASTGKPKGQTGNAKRAREKKDGADAYKPDRLYLDNREIIFRSTHGDLHLSMLSPHENVASVAKWLRKNKFMDEKS